MSAIASHDAPLPCTRCEGTGVVVTLRERCCGNLTKGGECRAHCCVPEEIEDQCPQCEGRGQ